MRMRIEGNVFRMRKGRRGRETGKVRGSGKRSRHTEKAGTRENEKLHTHYSKVLGGGRKRKITCITVRRMDRQMDRQDKV